MRKAVPRTGAQDRCPLGSQASQETPRVQHIWRLVTLPPGC